MARSDARRPGAAGSGAPARPAADRRSAPLRRLGGRDLGGQRAALRVCRRPGLGGAECDVSAREQRVHPAAHGPWRSHHRLGGGARLADRLERTLRRDARGDHRGRVCRPGGRGRRGAGELRRAGGAPRGPDHLEPEPLGLAPRPLPGRVPAWSLVVAVRAVSGTCRTGLRRRSRRPRGTLEPRRRRLALGRGARRARASRG